MQKSLNWNSIYKENSPKLLGICRRYVSDLATAEDILQDSFLKAIENQHQLKEEKALFGWLKKIVINNALQYLKKSKDFSSKEITADFTEIEEEIEESNFLSHQFSTEEMLASIDNLPAHHKAVFNLYFLENYSHAEITEQLEININTSRSHLLRAKKSVKEQLMNINKNNTLKKRGILMLVFLGFGNLLWAKSFQKNFSNFAITPQKIFQPEIFIENSKVGNSKSTSTKKNTFKKSIVVLILSFSLVFFIYQYSGFITNETPNIKENNLVDNQQNLRESKKPELIQENISTQTTNENAKTKKEKVEKQSTELKEISLSKSKNKDVTEKTDQKNSDIEGAIISTKITSPILDTAKISKPKKVIVVKKIIKRDTVYIKK